MPGDGGNNAGNGKYESYNKKLWSARAEEKKKSDARLKKNIKAGGTYVKKKK